MATHEEMAAVIVALERIATATERIAGRPDLRRDELVAALARKPLPVRDSPMQGETKP